MLAELHGDESTNVFVWNIGVGVCYAVNDNLALDLGYRYTDYATARGKIMADQVTNFLQTRADLSSQEVLIGVRYTF
ncbi:MAG: outer membrane beta-barrel protein [Puniceicoccales bacterium]|jgi:opacity protein-like surface antigen|nr:outer membrane beta-barrel protein [Puniceicoccales bacterium]